MNECLYFRILTDVHAELVNLALHKFSNDNHNLTEKCIILSKIHFDGLAKLSVELNLGVLFAK